MMKLQGQNYIAGNKNNINTSTKVPSANTATKVSDSKASDGKSQQQEPFRNTSAPTQVQNPSECKTTRTNHDQQMPN